MISKEDKKTILDLAEKYKVKSIILFGSSLAEKEHNDIDLAVGGIKDEDFFKFYGEMFKRISKPVDIVDLSVKSSFNDLILKRGVKIYG